MHVGDREQPRKLQLCIVATSEAEKYSSENTKNLSLRPLAKYRKAAICFVMSVRQYGTTRLSLKLS
jgi:hypothetical protein